MTLSVFAAASRSRAEVGHLLAEVSPLTPLDKIESGQQTALDHKHHRNTHARCCNKYTNQLGLLAFSMHIQLHLLLYLEPPLYTKVSLPFQKATDMDNTVPSEHKTSTGHLLDHPNLHLELLGQLAF